MHTIYNTHTGAFQYGATLSRSTMNLSMAKSLNPNIKPNEITKGMKLYDWDKALWFSLNVNECMKLMMWWESAAGNPAAHDTPFHLIHKSNNGNSFFDFHKYNNVYYATISTSKENRVQMALKDDELRLFLKAVNWVCNEMIMMTDVLKEMGKITKGNSSFNPGNDQNGKPWQNSNQGGNNNYNRNNGDGEYGYDQGGGYDQGAQSYAPPSAPTNAYAPPPPPPGNGYAPPQPPNNFAPPPPPPGNGYNAPPAPPMNQAPQQQNNQQQRPAAPPPPRSIDNITI